MPSTRRLVAALVAAVFLVASPFAFAWPGGDAESGIGQPRLYHNELRDGAVPVVDGPRFPRRPGLDRSGRYLGKGGVQRTRPEVNHGKESST